SQHFHQVAVIDVAQRGKGGGTHDRLLGALGDLQDELGLAGPPFLAKFQSRQGRHADFQTRVVQQRQRRSGVIAEGGAQGLDLRKSATRSQVGRPFLARRQTLGKNVGATQRRRPRVV